MEDKDINWVEYPETQPTLNGYYMALYFNPVANELLYKALWYSAEQQMFQGHWPWAWYIDKEWVGNDGKNYRSTKFLPLDVKKFVPESRADYYTQCGI